MTAHLMSCGAGLIRPYVDSLVRVLLKRVPDSNARVSSNCLVALGRTHSPLCTHSRDSLRVLSVLCLVCVTPLVCCLTCVPFVTQLCVSVFWFSDILSYVRRCIIVS